MSRPQQESGQQIEVIDSPDTDVFLLIINMYTRLPMATSFLTGKGSQKKKIPIQPIYNKIGVKQASAILGFHAFTGSDTSRRFAGRSKEWCFKVFLQSCDDDILSALGSLGIIDPSPETCSQLERFVCLLYKSTVYTTVKDLRWFLFSNRSAEGEKLPPTLGSLTQHIQRAHYITMIWKKADESHPNLPSPSDYEWNKDHITNSFVPVRCSQPPAPKAVLELVKCGCKKGCSGNCSCIKSKIQCTELCGCINYTCSNKMIEQETSDIDLDDSADEAEI